MEQMRKRKRKKEKGHYHIDLCMLQRALIAWQGSLYGSMLNRYNLSMYPTPPSHLHSFHSTSSLRSPSSFAITTNHKRLEHEFHDHQHITTIKFIYHITSYKHEELILTYPFSRANLETVYDALQLATMCSSTTTRDIHVRTPGTQLLFYSSPHSILFSSFSPS